MNYPYILKKIKEYKKLDDEIQDAMDAFIQVISPSSYSPVFYNTLIEAFVDGTTEDAEIKDWLGYYAYEVPNMKGKTCEVTDEKKRKYNFKKDADVLKFFKNNY